STAIATPVWTHTRAPASRTVLIGTRVSQATGSRPGRVRTRFARPTWEVPAGRKARTERQATATTLPATMLGSTTKGTSRRVARSRSASQAKARPTAVDPTAATTTQTT